MPAESSPAQPVPALPLSDQQRAQQAPHRHLHDHRKLGRELELFDSDPLIGAGLPYLRPAGAAVRHALEEFTASSPHVRLMNIEGDKYFGRIVANVVLSDGRNPADDMLAEGYAREYDGGRKPRSACANAN